MTLAEALSDLLSAFPDWLVVLFISMIPFVELRGALPVAILVYEMPLVEAFGLSIVGNMIPVPFILWAFDRIEGWFRRFGRWDRVLDRLFDRTRRRARAAVDRYGPLILFLFVAIPLPTTGAWTGSLIAYLFALDRRRSILVILLGVLGAAGIVGAIVLGAAAIGWALVAAMVVLVVVMALAARRIEAPPDAGPSEE